MWICFLMIVCLANGLTNSMTIKDVDYTSTITPDDAGREIAKYLMGIGDPEKLEKTNGKYPLSRWFKGHYDRSSLGISDCAQCKWALRGLYTSRQTFGDKKSKEWMISLCVKYSEQTERLCRGMIELNADSLFYVLDKSGAYAEKTCSLILQDTGCEEGQGEKWTIDIPKGFSKATLKKPKGDTFNILHLSDIHYDPRYTVGNKALCDEPICCQDDQPAKGGDKKCGLFSEYYNTDPPWATIENLLKWADDHHKFDYVYYTGDIVSHRIWDTSIKFNTDIIKKVAQGFKDRFKVPVYPAIGNHESHPLNEFSPLNITGRGLDTNWLFRLFWEETKEWLPEECKATILKGGYYTVSPKPGFRVISLNANVCYTFNWWQLLNDKDPYDQLKWLVEVLKKAEENDESVHILSHIPAGQECNKHWSDNYANIINRFANTITGMFVGHTHRDEFNIYFNRTSGPIEAVAVTYNGASVTAHTDANPSYKIFKVDKENYSLLDYDEYTFNLTYANEHGKMDNWYKLYSFRDIYGVADLTPREIGPIAFRLASNRTLLQEFNWYRFRHSDTGLRFFCDDDCFKGLLCDVATTAYYEKFYCDKLKRIYDSYGLE